MQHKKWYNSWPVIVSCVALGVWFFPQALPLGMQFLHSSAIKCIYPILIVQRSVAGKIRTWTERKRIAEDLEVLLQQSDDELSKLLAENITLCASALYMQDIEELREFKERYADENVVIAHVLLRQFSGNGHYFLVDAGADRGIESNMVVVYKNCLVGRVSSVYAHYSKVVLITDQMSKIPARCVETRAQGIHEGRNALEETTLTFMSHLVTLAKDDLVLSSGDGLVFPQGFGLGYVRSFALDTLGFTYEVTVEPLLDFKTLRYCCIMHKNSGLLEKEL